MPWIEAAGGSRGQSAVLTCKISADYIIAGAETKYLQLSRKADSGVAIG
jgi:hypothetical protein